MNPHTGMPVDFASIDPNDPLGFQKLLQLAGLGGAIQASPQGGERMRGAGGQELAALMAQQGLYDPSALDGYTAGQGRQDYNLTTYLRDPSGNLAGQETNYDREGMNSQDYLDAALKGAAVVASVYGAGTGLSALGVGGAGAGAAGTAAASAAVDPITAYLTTGAVEGSTLGTALSGAGGASGAVGSNTFASLLQQLGPLGTMIDSGSRYVAGTPLGSIPGSVPSIPGAPAVPPTPGVPPTPPGTPNIPGVPPGLLSGIGSVVAPVAGAVLGAVDGAKGQQDTQTQQSKLDPNMQRLLYGEDGKGGLLGMANGYFQQNQGPNATQLQGLDMQRNFYTDPAYAQGYGALRSQGMSLLGQPVAGNPFTRKGG